MFSSISITFGALPNFTCLGLSNLITELIKQIFCSTTFNIGPATSCNIETMPADYEVSGEGLREAIKNGDVGAAKKLLSQGVDANYCDKQGSSLLHLAAVFNRTEIVFSLMESGASLYCKNSQGETPLDCAPATLQFKMKKKMEESGQ
ncbi:hypothetical protein HAX54_016276 [Datura stramonium]|uniref:Uncharacterized protein n=1 Tax=Datura stramonium TaxID=4076 RepID=A0ABS8S027_DATST|nr:hypothetical protein [Datura stramonium]